MMVDKTTVAKFRLLLLAGASRLYLAEKGRLPARPDDLRSYFGELIPPDPFTGGEFDAEFSAERVRFSAEKSIPAWFDTQGTKYLPVISIRADGEVVEQ
jgi:hypothetical protein